jgi:hypothetical protein
VQSNWARNPKYIVNADSSANITGPWILVGNETSIGFAVTMTGSNTGTWSMEATQVDNVVDPNNVAPTAAQIVQVPSPAGWAALQPAAAAVSALFDAPAPSAMWVRLKYVRSANGAAASTNVQSFARGI